MKKILMVCLGNICRSPLAAGILYNKIDENGLDAQVDSAGTAAYHAGEGADRRSLKVAQKNGVDISQHRARKFTTGDFAKYDLIYAMDSENYQNIMALAASEKDKTKVKLLMNEVLPGENISVPDPYFGGDQGFENVYQMIDQACDRIIEKRLQ
jgi:protein-tyrosine phosphatase